jgi:Zn-dependent M28 family amino/carboxypeptidase
MRPFFIAVLLLFYLQASSQNLPQISSTEVTRIEKILSSDDMQGRKIFTPGIKKAEDFIISEFTNAGLKPFPGREGFKQSFSLSDPGSVEQKDDSKVLTNLIGIIPGKSKPDEYVIFSAHYDHLGMGKSVAGDSVFNGANDNASGTTAVIMLAKYFNSLKNNERTIIFVAFTGEEEGDFGSEYFSKNMDPAKTVAMLNIEMIGTESKWGKNSAYITGYDKSDFGQILQRNLKNSPFRFYPDPYLSESLFLRSDNASLAILGVPAFTISTSKMDSEKYYHTRGDSFETLDIENMTEVIRAIALSAGTIIAGKDTPLRIHAE